MGDYLDPGAFRNLKFLTIADYTFIANPAIKVSMSGGKRAQEGKNEALVVVNQVGYNTTYAIDLLKEDEELEKSKTTRPTELSVKPGSWEDEDGDGAVAMQACKSMWRMMALSSD